MLPLHGESRNTHIARRSLRVSANVNTAPKLRPSPIKVNHGTACKFPSSYSGHVLHSKRRPCSESCNDFKDQARPRIKGTHKQLAYVGGKPEAGHGDSSRGAAEGLSYQRLPADSRRLEMAPRI